jgi:HK97 family phage portal protein
MKFRDSLRAIIARAGNPFTINSPEMWKYLSGGPLRDVNIIGSVEAYCTSVWVRKCVDRNAGNVARTPFEVMRKTAKIEKHPLLDFLAAPNADISTFELWYTTVAHLGIFGNSYWLLERKGLSTIPTRMFFVDPRRVRPVVTLDKRSLMGYELRMEDGSTVYVDRADIAHFKMPNPLNQWVGEAPLEAAKLATSSDVAAQKYNLAFFENGAVPRGVLVTDKALNKVAVDQLIEKFMERHRNPHIPAVLHSGLSWVETQLTAQDMEFQIQRKFNREEILAAFGVPPIEVGLLEYASFENARAQRRMYWETTLIPIITLLAATVQRDILRDTSLSASHTTAHVEELREALKDKVSTAKDLFGMGVPFNVIDERVDLGIGKVDGGDVGYLPFSLAPAGQLDSGSGTEDGADAGVTTELTLNGAQIQSALEVLLQLAKGALAEEAAIALLVAVGIPRDEAEKMVSAQVTEVDPEAVKPEPAPAPPANAGGDAQPEDKPAKPAADEAKPKQKGFDLERVLANFPTLDDGALTRDANGILSPLLRGIEDDNGKLKSLSSSYFKNSYQTGQQQMADLMNIDVRFDIDNPRAVKFLESKLIKVTRINDVTRDALRESLMEGLSNGESIDQLSDRVRDVYNFTTSRARTIARTEISQAVNAGRFEVLQVEATERHDWLSARDERVRDSHAAEDGSEVVVGEPFPETGLMYPGDGDGPPEEIINCRCITLPADSQRSFNRVVDRDAYWHRSVAQWEPVEKRYQSALKAYFFDQRSRVLAALAKMR